jgi:hypothetical protein
MNAKAATPDSRTTQSGQAVNKEHQHHTAGALRKDEEYELAVDV